MNGHGKEKAGNGLVRAALGAVTIAAALLVAGGRASAAHAAPAAAAASEASGKVDVNSANETELASLPGIGESKAAAIIAEREKKPFASVDDLERVRGIGARTVDDLRSKVSVGGH
jgi:competence protein ComEA